MEMVIVDDNCLKQADSHPKSGQCQCQCQPWIQVAWSEGRRPLGTTLHSPDEPSELSQWHRSWWQ